MARRRSDRPLPRAARRVGASCEIGDTKNASRLTPRLRLLADGFRARAARAHLRGGTGTARRRDDPRPRPPRVRLRSSRLRPGCGAGRRRARIACGLARHRLHPRTGRRAGAFSIVRLSTRPPSSRPTLNDEDRRLFIETVLLMNPQVIHTRRSQDTGGGHQDGSGPPHFERPATSRRSPAQLAPARTTLLTWSVQPARGSASVTLGVALLGLEPGCAASSLDAWGVPGEPRIGCLCLQMPAWRQADLSTGRWHTTPSPPGFPISTSGWPNFWMISGCLARSCPRSSPPPPGFRRQRAFA